MIVVRLIGGLGNQMFQYALGRHLAIINHTVLKLDLSYLVERPLNNKYTFRNFELDKFNIEAQIAQKSDIAFFFSNSSIAKSAFNRIKKLTNMISIRNETGFGFQPEMLSIRKNVFLNGYWQSEKYFSPVSRIIKNDFTIKDNFLDEILNSGRLNDVLNKITQTNSVAIHFRRGDYFHDINTYKHHGICSKDYYQNAISFLIKQTSLPHFFLFSDEPSWLKANFTLEVPFTIVENNPGYTDLYLMSSCKHNIIANSSFSWWGAWLNRNAKKIVVAPDKWFNDSEKNEQTKDLIPEKWIRM